MKHLSTPPEYVSDEREPERLVDPQAEFIHRAFLAAHGHPHGPLSTLTGDRHVQMEVRKRGVPTA